MLIIYRLKLISEELLDTSNLFKNSMYVEGWKYGKLRAGKSLEKSSSSDTHAVEIRSLPTYMSFSVLSSSPGNQ